MSLNINRETIQRYANFHFMGSLSYILVDIRNPYVILDFCDYNFLGPRTRTKDEGFKARGNKKLKC